MTNLTVVILTCGTPHGLQSDEDNLKQSIAESVNKRACHHFKPSDVDITYAVVEGGAHLGADFPEACILARMIIPRKANFMANYAMHVENDIRKALREALPGYDQAIEADVILRI